METIRVTSYNQVPSDFTGIVSWLDNKLWVKNGNFHRVDGPAVEGAYGGKAWYLNGNLVFELKSTNYICIQDGLPCQIKWMGKSITQKKVLTPEGIMYIPNLPGI